MKIWRLVFLFPLYTSAQDITGVWTGYIKTPGSQLDYELAISGGDKKLSGYSLIIYPKDGIENIGIKSAKITRSKNKIYFEDGELVYDNFTTQPRRVKMFGNLSLVIKDTLMILQGEFGTRSLDFRDMRTYDGQVYLEKKYSPASTKMLVTLDEINYRHGLSFVKSKKNTGRPASNLVKTASATTTKPPQNPIERKIEKISEVFFSSDSLVLNIYDNGTIDGDTVSINLNGRTLAEKVGLTARAVRITIPSVIRQEDSLLLVMHAESLGLIPPNTGLIIIEDGATRHEIRFSGDFQKSSAIVFKRKRQ